jgi:hypothetical protein
MTTSALNKLPALLIPRTVFDPEQDGETHINVSTNGKTELGRKLAHFAVTPFIHPIYGPFKSMEGFWHFIKCEEKDDNFRTLTASRAKAYAKTKKMVWRENFVDVINEANYHKVEQNEDIKRLIIESELPFAYYYMFGPEQLQIFPQQAPWLCAGFDMIRQLMKEGKSIEPAPKVVFMKPQSETIA